MNQKQNIRLIKKILKDYWPEYQTRFIKIHGGPYQEKGLPDLMILCHRSILKGHNDHIKFWLEIKRNWKDDPTKLQKFIIEDLRQFGFITGFISDNEYKEHWSQKIPTELFEFFNCNL